jgi:hypothetical protein
MATVPDRRWSSPVRGIGRRERRSGSQALAIRAKHHGNRSRTLSPWPSHDSSTRYTVTSHTKPRDRARHHCIRTKRPSLSPLPRYRLREKSYKTILGVAMGTRPRLEIGESQKTHGREAHGRDAKHQERKTKERGVSPQNQGPKPTRKRHHPSIHSSGAGKK